jgi:hypothetical protein
VVSQLQDMHSKEFEFKETLVIRLNLRVLVLALGLMVWGGGVSLGAENAPHRPFAQWAELPQKGDLVVGLIYEESEAYQVWAKNERYNVTVHANGESYGIDINQGYLALQYGLLPKWAFDLNVGYTSMGTRSFSGDESIDSASGLMDWSFGVRYQIFNETEAQSPWIPTLTFRAGAVLPGTFDEHIEFAPGLRSASIEPELLLRKHFGWPGFGAYGDLLYRWNKTTGTDQYVATIGVFQQIKGWELDVGYRRLQTLSGEDITFEDPNDVSTLVYPRGPREIVDAIEFGFSYTTAKHKIRYGFHGRTVFDGNNTDRPFWIGGSIDIPFGIGPK